MDKVIDQTTVLGPTYTQLTPINKVEKAHKNTASIGDFNLSISSSYGILLKFSICIITVRKL